MTHYDNCVDGPGVDCFNPHGKKLTLEITNMCFEACWWCSSDAKPDGKHMPLERVFAFLNHFRGECSEVRLSGGEPTLHPDFHAIVQRAHDLGYYVVVLTNGREIVRNALVGTYMVSCLGKYSVDAVRAYREAGHIAILTGVIGTDSCPRAISEALTYEIPLHLYRLQCQGRAAGVVLPSITVTGEGVCKQDQKITVQVDGTVCGCSGEKNGHRCNVRGECFDVYRA